MSGEPPKGRGPAAADRRQVRIGALLAGLLVVGLLAWLIFHDGGDAESPSGGPEAVTVETLRDNAASSGTPIYWAGPQDDAELELTTVEGGNRIYVRYLTGGAEPGDARPRFLTVGTYVFPDAQKALKRQAREAGGELRAAPGGATVYVNPERPQSVYLAYPGVEVEIEVYDPNPQRALNLVTAGQIVPVS